MIYQEGKTYYRFSETISLNEYIYKDKKFFTKKGNKVSFNEHQLSMIKETPDEAVLTWFLEERETRLGHVRDQEKRLQRYKKDLSNLEEKYDYLKEIYPEEFI